MSKADSFVYDMSVMGQGSPNIFVQRSWLNILDSQNGNYQGSQSVVDTSQLANSNKYMSYREAYLAIPLLMTASSGSASSSNPVMTPATASTSVDLAFGLKNWIGSIVHSMTVDLAGTTIVQQTPLCNMWSSFGLMTTLSLQDVATNGAQMGFYPDDPLAWEFQAATNGSGLGVCSNSNAHCNQIVAGQFNSYKRQNMGLLARQNYFALDPQAATGPDTGGASSTFSAVLSTSSMNQLYKSYIFNKTNPDNTNHGVIQYAIQGILQLRHLHSFFNQIPLLKGLFLKLTLNLNQPSVTVSPGAGTLNLVTVSTPIGGVSPIMVASEASLASGTTYTTTTTGTDGTGAAITATSTTRGTIAQGGSGLDPTGASTDTVLVTLCVGNKVVNATQQSTPGVQNSPLNQSISLYVPAYTFAPRYEEAYLSSPTKSIIYTDIYQFPTASVASGAQFNFLISNGIANIKSVLVLPFFNGIVAGSAIKPWQSPFDPAGCGPTSPMALISNFQCTIAGQNMNYNTQKYAFEQFMNNLQGCNAVNGDLIDGLTSSLIDQTAFEQEYVYFYTNCSRMMEVDEAVPKSVQISGTNMSTQEVSYIVFVEYGVQVAVDVLTGARV